jgi:hypothetical protein
VRREPVRWGGEGCFSIFFSSFFLILSLTCGFVCWSPGPTESNLSGRVLVVLSCNFFTLHYFNFFTLNKNIICKNNCILL